MYFDVKIGRLINEDLYFECKTWEQAESKSISDATDILLNKIGMTRFDVDVFIAGDLLNQCISSGYCMRNLGIPFFGLYGACSTFCESLTLASLFVNAGYASKKYCN